MSGDPRCILCRGAGTLRDSAGRDEVCSCANGPIRDPYAPGEASWVGEMLEGAMRAAEERLRAAQEHSRTCTDRPCVRCERYVCACGKPFEGANNRRCRECWQVERRAQLLEPMRKSVPRRFRWAFEAPPKKLTEAVKASEELISRAIANPPSSNFTLMGDTAMGKTTLIAAMLDAWVRQDVEQRKGGLFVEARVLAGARARFPLGQGEAPEVAEAMAAPMLVIDDLGSEVDDRRNVMQDLIFHRHNEELPTWLTTGFDANYLVGRYGSQIIRRLVEHGKKLELRAKP